MNTTKRFDNAIAALLKGYLKGTLQPGNCYACAVGNMIVHANKLSYKTSDNGDSVCSEPISIWKFVFATTDGGQHFNLSEYEGDTKQYIDSTQYSVAELAKIEYAFEMATKIKSTYWAPFNDIKKRHTPEAIDADQLAGLMAVVDVLCDIEGITDPAPYKAQFDKSLPLADIIVG